MTSVTLFLYCLLVISTLVVTGEAKKGGSQDDPEECPGDPFAIPSLLATIEDMQTFENKTGKRSPFSLLSLFHKDKSTMRGARAAAILRNTFARVAERVKGLPGNRPLISRRQLDKIASLSGCARSTTRVRCPTRFNRMYRNIDGTCNNRKNKLWGSSLTPFQRFLPPIYEDQLNAPVGWDTSLEYNGFTLPSVRQVSNELITTPTNVEDPDYTHMLTQWGQFLDHDIDLTPTAMGQTMPKPGMDAISCSETCDNIMPCFPIPIPDDDPRIDNVLDKACMPFTRSSAVCGTGETSTLFNKFKPREQINQITSFIDASMVYGSTSEVAESLRDFSTDDGLLRVNLEEVDISSGMDLLPYQNEAVSSCSQNPNGENVVPCFLAGDVRANEVNTLIASHTIWVREHNRLARELKRINPHWNGEQIYQEARKIVGSEMQHITFTEYLPKILGQRGMDQMGEYAGYNPNVNPSTRNEFATAAFRFGHAAIGEFVRRLDENYDEAAIGHVTLSDAFFSPWRIMRESGIDPVIRGLIGGFAKLVTPTQVMHEQLSQNLFKLRNQIALDLASLNTQRGRDHGMPFYNDWRVFCNLTRAASFDDLSGEISNSDVRDTLADVYGDVNNIDLWPAAQLEDHEDGARVGPTFRCMLAEQFKAHRDGDRFWFESDGVLTPSQRTEIRQVTYARIICDTTGITRLPPDVFRRSAVADMVACDDIPGINLQFWEDIPADEPCGEPAEVEDAYVQKCGENFSDTHIYTCDPGYAMAGAGEIRCLGGRVDNPPPTCSDIDECARGDLNNCEELCVNSVGSFMCACPEGFMLNDDGVSCSIDSSLSLGWIIAILFIVLFCLAMCAMVFVLVKGWHTRHQSQEIQRIKQLNAKPIDRNGVDNTSFISDKHDKKSLTGTSSGDSGVLEEDLDSLPGVVS